MKSASQSIYYQFAQEVDLTSKANLFISKINRLKGLSTAMQAVVKHELNHSEGKVVTEIYNQVEEHASYGELYYDSLKMSMQNMASYYSQIVNSNRFQYITVYYDIIEMNKV